MRYFCGNKLILPSKKHILHTLLLFDLKHCTIAEIYSDKSFNVLACKNSIVTNNHRQGGQSSQRFERARDNLITLWFKKLNDMVTNISGDIVIGSHEFYRTRFEGELTFENKKKIISFFSSEYCDESGVWQYQNTKNNSKK